MRILGLDLYGPMEVGPQAWGAVATDEFLLTGKLSDTEQMTNTEATPQKVTLRSIINTSAASGTVDVITANGTTTTRTLAAYGLRGDRINLFVNVVKTTGSLAASVLKGQV